MTIHPPAQAPSWAGYLQILGIFNAEIALLAARTTAELDAARRLARPALYTYPRRPR